MQSEPCEFPTRVFVVTGGGDEWVSVEAYTRHNLPFITPAPPLTRTAHMHRYVVLVHFFLAGLCPLAMHVRAARLPDRLTQLDAAWL